MFLQDFGTHKIRVCEIQHIVVNFIPSMRDTDAEERRIPFVWH